MATWRLLVGLAFALASSGLFAYAGWYHSRRVVSDQAALAQRAFVTWWYALAVITVGGALFTVMGNLGIDDLALWQVWTYASIAVLCGALWGLVYYLVYLFTGKTIYAPILGAGYVLYYFALLYFIQLQHPIGVELTPWRANLDYEFEVRGPFYSLIVALLLFPQIIGALAYFTLFFRVEDRAQRYRIALVSWSIVVWFASPLLALGNTTFANSDQWQIASRTIGLLAAIAILMAYRPPASVQRWIDQGRKGNKTNPPRSQTPPRAMQAPTPHFAAASSGAPF